MNTAWPEIYRSLKGQPWVSYAYLPRGDEQRSVSPTCHSRTEKGANVAPVEKQSVDPRTGDQQMLTTPRNLVTKPRLEPGHLTPSPAPNPLLQTASGKGTKLPQGGQIGLRWGVGAGGRGAVRRSSRQEVMSPLTEADQSPGSLTHFPTSAFC